MALLTYLEAQTYGLPSNTGATDQTVIEGFITAAEHMLATYCGFPPTDETGGATLEQATYTFYLHEPDPLDAAVLLLPVRPVVSVTSIFVDRLLAYAAATEYASSNWRLDKVRGHVRLLPTSQKTWPRSPEAIRVIAVCGLTTGSVDERVKNAMGLMVKHLWDTRHTAGRTSTTTAGNSQQRRPDTIPAQVRQLLSPYVMWERKMSGGQVVGIG